MRSAAYDGRLPGRPHDPLAAVILDMDVPIDGADAFIITTAERARDLALRRSDPRLHLPARPTPTKRTRQESLRRHGQQLVIDSLRSKSDIWIDDIDVFFPYDGFSLSRLAG